MFCSYAHVTLDSSVISRTIEVKNAEHSLSSQADSRVGRISYVSEKPGCIVQVIYFDVDPLLTISSNEVTKKMRYGLFVCGPFAVNVNH